MNSPELQQERREDARRKVRGWLAMRPGIAGHPAQIRNSLNAGHENDFTIEEVKAALEFLGSLAFAARVPDPMGATEYWQITATGILAHERDPLA